MVRRHRPARLSDWSNRSGDGPEGRLGRHSSRPRGQGARPPRIESDRVVDVERLPETSLVGQLQAGQLDAGFFYGVEAAAADIKTIPLSGTDLAGVYTLTVLNRAPHEAAARAFVTFILGNDGQRILKKNGIVAFTPTKVIGKSSVPKDLKQLVSR